MGAVQLPRQGLKVGLGDERVELIQWVRREEQYAILGTNAVVELNSESHARQPTSRAWAIIRRAERSHRLAGQRASRVERRHAPELTAPAGPSSPQERQTAADAC